MTRCNARASEAYSNGEMIMLRKVEPFECDDSDDLVSVLAYAGSRTDGGRTIIHLNGAKKYYLSEPLIFPSESRVTIDFDGLTIRLSGGGCIIEAPFRPA